MQSLERTLKTAVNSLTLLVVVLLSSCAHVEHYFRERCKTHAYVDVGLPDYLKSRFHLHAPVRMAIIPFSTPANISWSSDQQPGLGNELVWKLHKEFLATEAVSIVEVLNRPDWPGKKEEFYTGNFGSISLAREAGYDLVLVGFVRPISDMLSLTIDTKLIDTESGTTVWYGQTTVTTRRDQYHDLLDTVGVEARKPSIRFTAQIVDKAARCMANDISQTN